MQGVLSLPTLVFFPFLMSFGIAHAEGPWPTGLPVHCFNRGDLAARGPLFAAQILSRLLWASKETKQHAHKKELQATVHAVQ